MTDKYHGKGGSYVLVNGKRIRAEDYKPETKTPKAPLVEPKPKTEDEAK